MKILRLATTALLGFIVLLLGLHAIAQMAPSSMYSYPGYGELRDQSGAKLNDKRYTVQQACIDDAWAMLATRKAANPSLTLDAVECWTSKGYAATYPAPAASTPGLGRLPANPVLSLGASGPQVRATSELPAGPTDIGAFRTVCAPSHLAFDDPIVFPGQPGKSHMHLFFGNTGANANSTDASIATSGNGTCAGGTLNRSAYWVPAMIDMATGLPIIPNESVFYYKTAYGGVRPADVKPVPTGLRMIAGDARNASDIQYGAPFLWVCHNDYPRHGTTFPDCAVGDELDMVVTFPQCWNGHDLDSPDHKSHMAYPTGAGCPSGYPVALPEISLHITYPITSPGQAQNWRLASDTYTGPPGYSAHADFIGGWDSAIMQTIITNCENKSMDCHAYLLGDGRMLY